MCLLHRFTEVAKLPIVKVPVGRSDAESMGVYVRIPQFSAPLYR